jgi:hypothetical protein
VKAKDIMTTPVVTVEPDTTVREIAALLLERHISGVPVVEAGRFVGLVSEGDLLHRHELGTDRNGAARSWWLSLMGEHSAAAEYVKSHARRARDIMTRNVISVAEDTPIAGFPSCAVSDWSGSSAAPTSFRHSRCAPGRPSPRARRATTRSGDSCSPSSSASRGGGRARRT